MAYTVLGLDAMTLVRTFTRTTLSTGTVKVTEYEGPRDKAETFRDSARDAIFAGSADYDEVEYGHNGGLGFVALIEAEADDPQNEDDNAIWELVGETQMIPIAQHPYFTSVSGAIVDDIRQCEQAIAAGIDYDSASSTFSEMVQYYGLRMSGVEVYPNTLPVLRKTIRISNRSEIEVATDGSNYAVSLASINPPAKLGDLSDYEWLKRTPRMLSRDGGKTFEISYEWVGDLQWSKALYNNGASPVLATWDPQL